VIIDPVERYNQASVQYSAARKRLDGFGEWAVPLSDPNHPDKWPPDKRRAFLEALADEQAAAEALSSAFLARWNLTSPESDD
jgi:hypothetical protein